MKTESYYTITVHFNDNNRCSQHAVMGTKKNLQKTAQHKSLQRNLEYSGFLVIVTIQQNVFQMLINHLNLIIQK